jgi:multidrug transporter EmrE-like cation transporter
VREMVYLWLALAIASTVGYHVVMKITPAASNPFLSLAVTYAIGSAIFLGAYAVSPGGAALRTSMQALSWTPFALAGVVVLLDIGFLLLYRTGYDVSLGQIVTQSAAAMLLVIVGVALFREKLTLVNVAGIVLCVAGLWLINRK